MPPAKGTGGGVTAGWRVPETPCAPPRCPRARTYHVAAEGEEEAHRGRVVVVERVAHNCVDGAGAVTLRLAPLLRPGTGAREHGSTEARGHGSGPRTPVVEMVAPVIALRAPGRPARGSVSGWEAQAASGAPALHAGPREPQKRRVRRGAVGSRRTGCRCGSGCRGGARGRLARHARGFGTRPRSAPMETPWRRRGP